MLTSQIFLRPNPFPFCFQKRKIHIMKNFNMCLKIVNCVYEMKYKLVVFVCLAILLRKVLKNLEKSVRSRCFQILNLNLKSTGRNFTIFFIQYHLRVLNIYQMIAILGTFQHLKIIKTISICGYLFSNK